MLLTRALLLLVLVLLRGSCALLPEVCTIARKNSIHIFTVGRRARRETGHIVFYCLMLAPQLRTKLLTVDRMLLDLSVHLGSVHEQRPLPLS